MLAVQYGTPLGLLIFINCNTHMAVFRGPSTKNSKSRQRPLSLNTPTPSTIGNTEYYHGSRSILRITKSAAMLGYLTSQLRGASTDQSCNAVIFPCNINIIKSCLRTPEQKQLRLFLLSIHHRHLYAHSTIFTVLAQESKTDGGYLFYTEVTIYHGTKELATSSQFRLWMTKQAID